MVNLQHIQNLFHDTLIGCTDENQAAFTALLNDLPQVRAKQGLNCYLTNYNINLRRVIYDTFKATLSILGASESEEKMNLYIREHPSVSANIHDFALEFPNFLEKNLDDPSLSYLIDLAHFEKKYHLSERIPYIGPPDVSLLQKCSPDCVRFIPQPSLLLLKSAYPVEKIKHFALTQENQSNQSATFELPENETYYFAICSSPNGTQVTELNKEFYIFVELLNTEPTLAALVRETGDALPHYLPLALQSHFIAKLVID